MEKIEFDTGVREFAVGGGVLRFNPGDPNVYARFLESLDKLAELEETLKAQAALAPDDTGLTLLVQADRQIKEILAWIFGPDNDFDGIFGGVNLLAVGENGQRVVTNFFTALEPVLLAGVDACVAQQTQAAVDKAKTRRAKK